MRLLKEEIMVNTNRFIVALTVLVPDQRDRKQPLKTSVSIKKFQFSTPTTVYIVTQYSDVANNTGATSLH